jgi:hypothetical protein
LIRASCVDFIEALAAGKSALVALKEILLADPRFRPGGHAPLSDAGWHLMQGGALVGFRAKPDPRQT